MTIDGTTAQTATMRASMQDTYGTADAWRQAQVPRPQPVADEVLIRVRAAGLDRGTWHLMAGKPYLLRLGFGLRGPEHPIPGRDLAGTVEAVGPRSRLCGPPPAATSESDRFVQHSIAVPR